MMAKSLKAIAGKVPAFGVLFETVSEAKVDLLYFSIMMLSVLMACVVITYCIFGPNSPKFESQPQSAITLLRMMFGLDVYVADIHNANPSSALWFYVFYCIIFYFVIVNLYAAIVMRTYDNLRQKKQLVTEAMALIETARVEEHSRTFWSIIFCRVDHKA